MLLETAGEGPTNQVLQIHMSIAQPQSIAVCLFLFWLLLLLLIVDIMILPALTHLCILLCSTSVKQDE